MRKLWLIALFFYISLCCFSEENNLFRKYFKLELLTSVQLPDFTDSDFTGRKLIDNITYGGKISTSFFDGKFYKQGSKETFGFSFFSDKYFPKLPVTLKIGSLNYSGLFTKLSSPALSNSINAFTTSSTSVTGITASLPSTSTFSKNPSYFVQYNFPKNHFIEKSFINIAYLQNSKDFFSFSDDDYVVFSFYSQLHLINTIKVDFSTALGVFPYEENIPSGWFSENKYNNYYQKGSHYSQNIQTAINYKGLSSSVITSFYESPFGNYDFCIRNENIYNSQKITLSFSDFYSSSNLFSSSNKIIKSQVQFKTSCQYNFITMINNNYILSKIGFGTYFFTDEDNLSLKLAVGIRTSTSKSTDTFSVLINTSSTNQYSLVFSGLNVQLKNSFHIKKSKNTITSTFTFTPNQSDDKPTTSEKLQFSFANPNLANINFGTTLAFTQKKQKDNEISLNSSCSLKFAYKKINYTVKIKYNYDF